MQDFVADMVTAVTVDRPNQRIRYRQPKPKRIFYLVQIENIGERKMSEAPAAVEPIIETPVVFTPKPPARQLGVNRKKVTTVVDSVEVPSEVTTTAIKYELPRTLETPQHPTEILINQGVNAPEEIETIVVRVSPKFETFEPYHGLSLSDLRHVIQSEHGPGIYKITVRKNGIDVPVPAGQLNLTLHIGGNAKNGAAKEDNEDPVKAAKNKTSIAHAELERSKIEMERRKLEKNAEEKPVSLAEIELAALKKTVEDLNRKLEASAAKPAEPLVDQVVKLAPLITAIAALFPKQAPLLPQTNASDLYIKTLGDLVTTLIAKKADAPDTTKAMLEARQQARNEFFEMQEYFDQRTRGGEEEFDPNAGVGNFWILASKLFKSFQSSPIAARLAAEYLDKPAASLTEADAQQLTREMQELRAQRRLPTAVNPPQLQQPAPRPVAAANPVPSPSKPASEQREIQPQQSNGEVPGAPEHVAASQTAAVAVAETPLQAALKDDLQQEIEVSVEEMVLDIAAGRTIGGEHRWIEGAARLWNQDFLKELKAEPNMYERMLKIRNKVSEPVWKQVDDALLTEKQKAGGEAIYQRFFESFNMLIEERRRYVASLPAETPPPSANVTPMFPPATTPQVEPNPQ